MLIVKDSEYCVQKGLFRVMEIFSILMVVVMVSGLHMFVRSHKTVHLNKYDFKNPVGSGEKIMPTEAKQYVRRCFLLYSVLFLAKRPRQKPVFLKTYLKSSNSYFSTFSSTVPFFILDLKLPSTKIQNFSSKNKVLFVSMYSKVFSAIL